jgi:hypothetical protein
MNWQSDSSMRPCVQILALPEKKKKSLELEEILELIPDR